MLFAGLDFFEMCSFADFFFLMEPLLELSEDSLDEVDDDDDDDDFSASLSDSDDEDMCLCFLNLESRDALSRPPFTELGAVDLDKLLEGDNSCWSRLDMYSAEGFECDSPGVSLDLELRVSFNHDGECFCLFVDLDRDRFPLSFERD